MCLVFVTCAQQVHCIQDALGLLGRYGTARLSVRGTFVCCRVAFQERGGMAGWLQLGCVMHTVYRILHSFLGKIFKWGK